MAKIVFICFKDNKNYPYCKEYIERLTDKIIPDNIRPNPTRIINARGISIGIFNPISSLLIKDTSVCMGHMLNTRSDWWKPSADVPEGSYALFRSDENAVELISDMAASRTIWYAHTEDMFIASTTQRAIISWLRSFMVNSPVFSWFLSTGSMGPGLSWDKRIKCLGPDSRLFLDRFSWKLAIKKADFSFQQSRVSFREHEMRFKNSIDSALTDLELDWKRWVLALSGGYDSRYIFMKLRKRFDFKCITWGVQSSLSDKKSDAYAAILLTKHFNVRHEFIKIDFDAWPIEKIMERFLIAGEGRVDRLPGYMDGLNLWKYIFDSGVEGIIRGDHIFCCAATPVRTVLDVRHSVFASFFSDFRNLKNLDKYGFDRQVMPDSLERRPGESLTALRDRLGLYFYSPAVLSALNDLKLSYVEIAAPLNFRRVIVSRAPLRVPYNVDNFMKKVFIRTFGCQMNEHDSARLKDLLLDRGHAVCGGHEDADVIIINTCSVRKHAEDRVYGAIGEFQELKPARPGLIIGIIGCMAEARKDDIFRRIPIVDFLCGPADLDRVPDIIDKISKGAGHIMYLEGYKSKTIPEFSKDRNVKDRAFVKIMEGCDNFCSYCIVPYVRGRERSRPSKEILDEIRKLIGKGVKEITLLGQNVNSYGKGLKEKINFVSLLTKIDHLVHLPGEPHLVHLPGEPGCVKVSFFTSHPKDAGPGLFKAMRDLKSIVNILHLPIQSGSDKILRRMNRKYTVAKYKKLVSDYRKIVKGGNISSDIIVGFPSETEKDFRDTFNIVKELQFDAAYIFKYSPRSGTKAAEFKDDVSIKEKERRHGLILGLQRDILAGKKCR